jgi:hypothetical protein
LFFLVHVLFSIKKATQGAAAVDGSSEMKCPFLILWHTRLRPRVFRYSQRTGLWAVFGLGDENSKTIAALSWQAAKK